MSQINGTHSPWIPQLVCHDWGGVTVEVLIVRIEWLSTQLVPTSLDLDFMYPFDQFTKQKQSKVARDLGSHRFQVSIIIGSIRWYQQEKIAVVARLRPTKPSPNVPWIRDRRREGFRGLPGKMVEHDLQIMGFPSLFWVFFEENLSNDKDGV